MRAIYEYTTDAGYRTIHEYLRNYPDADPGDIAALESRIAHATQGLANLPAQPSLGGVYFRGVGMTPEFLSQFEVGKVWSDPSFMSSSSNHAVANRFAAQAAHEGKVPSILTVEGNTPASITPFSRYQIESEFLFQRGSRFEVVGKFEDALSVWHIHLREMTP